MHIEKSDRVTHNHRHWLRNIQSVMTDRSRNSHSYPCLRQTQMNNEIIQYSEKYALFNKTTPNNPRQISYHDFHRCGFIHPGKDGVFFRLFQLLVDSFTLRKQLFQNKLLKKQVPIQINVHPVFDGLSEPSHFRLLSRGNAVGVMRGFSCQVKKKSQTVLGDVTWRQSQWPIRVMISRLMKELWFVGCCITTGSFIQFKSLIQVMTFVILFECYISNYNNNNRL